MRSSYIENGFGELLYLYMVNLRPANVVELGILDGFSTLNMAKGVRDCSLLYQHRPWFHAYDLFDDYEFKHGSMEAVKKLMVDNEVDQFVEIRQGNAYDVHQFYPDSGHDQPGIEFLHIDISNTGKVVNEIMELWHPKIAGRGIIAIEGGSEERDNVEWMKKYNHPSIKEAISTNPLLNKHYIYGTYFKFPSMTIAMRKWYVD